MTFKRIFIVMLLKIKAKNEDKGRKEYKIMFK